ncbi:hypothetical protein CRE_21370 [Caenorhabditis remanei]|uniref:Cullin family profile domain-containing protein n=1 Tax=Caenorhabditis remanei TaxID=31234 RepID=E3MUK7_CAERE|nr:hypothetical protein CRE_21370 [Caenorhabditis remanei]
MRDELVAVWPQFEEALELIFQRSPMNMKTYMQYTTMIYRYCTETYQLGFRAGDNVMDRVQEDLISVREFIAVKVDVVTKNCHKSDGQDLLKYLNNEWELFEISSSLFDAVFGNFNRHSNEVNTGKTDSLTRNLCMEVWKENLFDVLEEKIIGAALHLIHQERTGTSMINNRDISDFVVCLKKLPVKFPESDIKKDKTEDQKLKFYKESFESLFLKTTEEFYKKEVEDFMKNNGDVKDYMKNVEMRLTEEDVRVQLVLFGCTRRPLLDCLEKIMIIDQIDFIQSHFEQLLDEKSDEDLSRMFRLCSRIRDGLVFLRTALESHVVKEGLGTLERVAEEAFNDPKIYVSKLLEVHGRYSSLIRASFFTDSTFLKALDNAAINFINKNAVTMKGRQHSTFKSAELIARYCDLQFRKNTKMPDEIEMEKMQKQVIIILRYLEDKDVFLKIYTRIFSKRLINELSASDEAETSFIAKLTALCGYEYTSRLSKMFQDIQVSRDLSMDFKEKSSTNKSIDFNAQILSSGSWTRFPEFSLMLPQPLYSTIGAFIMYYNSKHNGRRLTWAYPQSRGEVTAFMGKKYVFTVTTPQMCVLLQFNNRTSYSVYSIKEATEMSKENTLTIIGSLVKTHVLKSNKELVKDAVPFDATITLNAAYTNKKVRVDLSRMPMKANSEKVAEESTHLLDLERKHVVEACIVRIMKMRKQMMHQDLVSEVVTQLTSRFQPKVGLIKKSIGTLIEKEYLKRSDKKYDLYEYLV